MTLAINRGDVDRILPAKIKNLRCHFNFILVLSHHLLHLGPGQPYFDPGSPGARGCRPIGHLFTGPWSGNSRNVRNRPLGQHQTLEPVPGTHVYPS
uniref:Uncharacterized protein n=1 Tax=Rhizophora mucronata TaxID=61149 RepID=A0A2P2JEN6_RHIMU